jgi:DNA-binding transcriptional regulator of glucitol operon
MKNLILTLIFTFAIQFTNIIAQEKNESIINLVSTLKQKVLLNDDQTTSIEKVLTELVSKSKTVEDKNPLIQDAQKKVESYLDRKQKMKYDIIKNEWWKQVSALL